jgi:hypothetical protein
MTTHAALEADLKAAELIELERDRNKARSRRKSQPFRSKPVTIGDLIREGKLLEVNSVKIGVIELRH